MSEIKWDYLRKLLVEGERQFNHETNPLHQQTAFTFIYENFPALKDHALDISREENELRPKDILIAFILLAIGPRKAGNPSEQFWEDLIKLTNTIDQNNIVEFLVAWGCGWGRVIPRHRTDPLIDHWNDRWTGAIIAFKSLVERSVHNTLRDLDREYMNGLLPRVQLLNEKTNLFSDAATIALELIKGECRCGHHIRSCKYIAGKWQCNKQCCQPDHDLANWKPTICSLTAYIAQAVRGYAGKKLKLGAFIDGVLYPFICQQNNILIGVVEFKICHKDGEKYRYDKCPTCKYKPDRNQTLYIGVKNKFLIPFNHGGDYTQRLRWKCRSCKNLVPYPPRLENLSKEDKAWEEIIQKEGMIKEINAHMNETPQKGEFTIEKVKELLKHVRSEKNQIQTLEKCYRCGGSLSQRPTLLWVYDPKEAQALLLNNMNFDDHEQVKIDQIQELKLPMENY